MIVLIGIFLAACVFMWLPLAKRVSYLEDIVHNRPDYNQSSEIEEEYENLINPSVMFSSTDDVREFIKDCDSVEALEAFKKECIKEDLFEFCAIIKEKEDELTKK